MIESLSFQDKRDKTIDSLFQVLRSVAPFEYLEFRERRGITNDVIQHSETSTSHEYVLQQPAYIEFVSRLCIDTINHDEKFSWITNEQPHFQDFRTSICLQILQEYTQTDVFIVCHSSQTIQYAWAKKFFLTQVGQLLATAKFADTLFSDSNVIMLEKGGSTSNKSPRHENPILPVHQKDHQSQPAKEKENEISSARFSVRTSSSASFTSYLSDFENETHPMNFDSANSTANTSANDVTDSLNSDILNKALSSTARLKLCPIKHLIRSNISLQEFSNVKYVTDGSNSQIFSCRWKEDNVIIKVIKPDKRENPVALHEFFFEYEALMRLDHPNIIKILGAGLVGSKKFMVLEKLTALTDVMNLDENSKKPSFLRKFTLGFEKVLILSKQIADAVNYMHEGFNEHVMILHRDLKPQNIGLTLIDGRVKLFDFGLCKCVLKAVIQSGSYQMTGNTGSIRYMAPEVALYERYDEKVDSYSFALVVWTMARNKQPFGRLTRAVHRQSVIENGLRPKLGYRGWPKEFDEFLKQCWHSQSDRRLSFRQIIDAIDEVLKIVQKSKKSWI